MITKELPSENSKAANFARRMINAMGSAIQAPDGSVNAADFLSYGDVLSYIDDMLLEGLSQFFVDTATWLLEGWERIYGIPTDSSLPNATRQQLLAAKVRATRSASVDDIKTAVGAITTSVIHENLSISLDPIFKRGVYIFVIAIPEAIWNDTAKKLAIERIGEQMKPAHMKVTVAVTVGFRTDDPLSLVDRDVLRL